MQWPHSTHAHSMASTAPSDWYSEVIIVHICVFQSTLLGFQVTSTSQTVLVILRMAGRFPDRLLILLSISVGFLGLSCSCWSTLRDGILVEKDDLGMTGSRTFVGTWWKLPCSPNFSYFLFKEKSQVIFPSWHLVSNGKSGTLKRGKGQC